MTYLKKETFKAWATPGAVALVIAALVSYTSFRTGYDVMAAQVNTNTAAVTALVKGMAALSKDKISELEGRLAVLEYIAGENGGLSQQQQLEYNKLKQRLKDLR